MSLPVKSILYNQWIKQNFGFAGLTLILCGMFHVVKANQVDLY